MTKKQRIAELEKEVQDLKYNLFWYKAMNGYYINYINAKNHNAKNHNAKNHIW